MVRKDKISKNVDEIYKRHLKEHKEREAQNQGPPPEKESIGWVAGFYLLFT